MLSKNNYFVVIYLVFCFVLFSGCSLIIKETPEEKAQIQKIINEAQSSKLIVLDVYHNRCKSCKLIEPVMEEFKKSYLENKDVAFLKYDLSTIATLVKSRKIARELGLEDIYKSQKYSGVVHLIDSMDKKVLNTFIGEYNLDKYKKLIEYQLFSKSSSGGLSRSDKPERR